jgi:hypothetical protein
VKYANLKRSAVKVRFLPHALYFRRYPCKGGWAVNDDIIKLIWRMVLNAMVGRRERTCDLYEKYLRKTRLYVPVQEILEAKGKKVC